MTSDAVSADSDQPPTDFSDLTVHFINCTLKRTPDVSHTLGLMEIAMSIMDDQGVETESIRAIDHE